MGALATIALLSTPAAADITWSAWHDRDHQGGSGDYEGHADYFSEGRIDCAAPVGVEARRTTDGVDAAATGETVNYGIVYGFYCQNVHQADGTCDDYEARYACPTGELDIDGQFTIEYDPDDLYIDGDEIYVVGEVAFVFGGEELAFDSATLELEFDGSALEIIGASTSGGFSSTIGPLAYLSLFIDNPLVDVSLGYGDATHIESLDTPINPEAGRTYAFLSIGTGAQTDVGGFTLSSASAGGATLVIDPFGPTVYAYAEGIFPSIGPLTIDELGLGFSADDDAFTWSPTLTRSLPLPDLTGNTWLEGGVSLGIGPVAGISLSGEVIAHVDWDDLANGEDPYVKVGSNGWVSVGLDLVALSIEAELAEGTVWYRRDDKLVVVGETTGSDMDFGPLTPFFSDVDASFEMLVEDNRFIFARAYVGLEFLDADIADAHIEVTPGGATVSGVLDYGSTEISVTGTVDSGGFELTGSASASLGDYEANVDITVNDSGLSYHSSLRVCIDYVFGKSCDTISSNISISGGHLKVCGAGLCIKV